MTTQGIRDFAARLDGEKDFAARLDARLAGLSDGGQMAAATVAFARDCGFAITEDEVNRLVADRRDEKTGALSDSDLEAVAGGIWRPFPHWPMDRTD